MLPRQHIKKRWIVLRSSPAAKDSMIQYLSRISGYLSIQHWSHFEALVTATLQLLRIGGGGSVVPSQWCGGYPRGGHTHRGADGWISGGIPRLNCVKCHEKHKPQQKQYCLQALFNMFNLLYRWQLFISWIFRLCCCLCQFFSVWHTHILRCFSLS